MPQLQRYAIGIFLTAVLLCLLVLKENTFSARLTLVVLIVFLIASMGFAYWVFFTPSGRAFAYRYDRMTPQPTSEQRKITKSKAYEYSAAGAILGFIISLPSVWAALQMLQIPGGGSFAIGYAIGIVVVVFIGYLSGFGQGLTQFSIVCPNCGHKFILPVSGGECSACRTGLYIDEHGDCKRRMA